MLSITLSALLLFAPNQDQAPVLQPAVVAAEQIAEIRPFYDRKTSVLIKLDAGTPLHVVHENVPWSRVQIPGGLVVWVHKDFVEIDGNTAVVKTSRLRARPMPSTDSKSHPVGKLKQDQRLPILDAKDDWLKVLAPEDLGAWVPSKEIRILNPVPGDWDEKWSTAASKRRQEILATAKPVTNGVQVPVVDPPPKGDSAQKVNEKNSVNGGVEVETTESSSAVDAVANTGSKLEPAASPRVPDAGSQSALLKQLVVADVFTNDPLAALANARANLDLHAKEVTDTLARFSPEVLDNCEWVFTEVLLKHKDPQHLASARLGLTRSDALRRFHQSALDAQLRKEDLQQQITSRNASSGKQKEIKIVPEGGTGAYAWVGHLQYRPHQYPKTPFVAVRGKREVLLHSYDGRFYLKDFLGREVAVRGNWRPSDTHPELQVLSVDELRVLPRASKGIK